MDRKVCVNIVDGEIGGRRKGEGGGMRMGNITRGVEGISIDGV